LAAARDDLPQRNCNWPLRQAAGINHPERQSIQALIIAIGVPHPVADHPN
jgi:hypothetical protein